MFALLKQRALVSYQAKYSDVLVKGCATLYSQSQRECVEQLKRIEQKLSGKIPEQIIIIARSPY